MSDAATRDLAKAYAVLWTSEVGRLVLTDIMTNARLWKRCTGKREEGQRDVGLDVAGMIVLGGGAVEFKLSERKGK